MKNIEAIETALTEACDKAIELGYKITPGGQLFNSDKRCYCPYDALALFNGQTICDRLYLEGFTAGFDRDYEVNYSDKRRDNHTIGYELGQKFRKKYVR